MCRGPAIFPVTSNTLDLLSESARTVFMTSRVLLDHAARRTSRNRDSRSLLAA